MDVGIRRLSRSANISLFSWHRRHPRIWRILRALLIALPLTLLSWNLSTNWSAVREHDWQIGGFRMALAVICLAVAFALIPVGSQLILRAFGYSLGYRDAFRCYFLAQPAKYLPGGFWVLPGRALALRQCGVSVAHSGGLQAMEVCLKLSATVVICSPYFLLDGFPASSPISRAAAVVLLVAVLLLCMSPSLFNTLAGRVLGVLRYPDPVVRMNTCIILGAVFTYIIYWGVTGVGFYLLISSVHELPLRHAPVALSALGAAWLAGFAAFLVPAGAGVREGALALLLAPLLPTPLPALLAILARLWWTVAEFILVLGAIALGRVRSELADTDE